MRSPRVVGDYHVDRREVQVQRCTEPTRTNSPITFVSSFRSSLSRHTGSRLWGSGNTKRRRRGGATPLPIPNRWESRRLPPLGGDDGQEYGYFLPPPPLPFLHAQSFLIPSFPFPVLPPSFPDPPPLQRPWPPSSPPSGPGAVFAPLRAGLRARPCGRGNRKQMHVSHQRAF